MRKSINFIEDHHNNNEIDMKDMRNNFHKNELVKSVDNPELFYMNRNNSCESIEALNLMKEEPLENINIMSDGGNIVETEFRTAMTIQIMKKEQLNSPVKIAGNKYLNSRARELPKYKQIEINHNLKHEKAKKET